MLERARDVKKRFVDPRVEFYQSHSRVPGFLFRGAGFVVVVLSATLPALSAATGLRHRTAYLTGASIAVAALTGLGSFFRWERTSRSYAASRAVLEQQVGRWELELVNAEFVLLLQNPDLAKRRVYEATMDLLTNAGAIAASDADGFFSLLQIPQRSEPNGNGR